MMILSEIDITADVSSSRSVLGIVLNTPDHGYRLGGRVVGGLIHNQTALAAKVELLIPIRPVRFGLGIDDAPSWTAWPEAFKPGLVTARAFPPVSPTRCGNCLGKSGDSVNHFRLSPFTCKTGSCRDLDSMGVIIQQNLIHCRRDRIWTWLRAGLGGFDLPLCLGD